MHIPSRVCPSLRLAAIACLAAAAANCGIEKQSAPPLAGPSEFGLSITLTASPDTLVQDGQAQSAINAVALDAASRPVAALTLQFSGTASTTTIPTVSFTQTTVVTDAQGRATTGLIAPPAPASLPTQPPTITVFATPMGSDFASTVPRQVVVRLTAPPGTLPPNNNPVPAFVFNPTVVTVNQNVTFDASTTTDEGVPCGSKCTYDWNFGDFTSGNGITPTHAYATTGTFTVTLTVRDDRGAQVTTTKTITVSAPTAPIASFTFSPAAPKSNTSVNFDATGSTVGSPATIVEYTWLWGDGSSSTVTTSQQTSHTFPASATAITYVVRLTVRDSLGRTATVTQNIAVAP